MKSEKEYGYKIYSILWKEAVFFSSFFMSLWGICFQSIGCCCCIFIWFFFWCFIGKLDIFVLKYHGLYKPLHFIKILNYKMLHNLRRNDSCKSFGGFWLQRWFLFHWWESIFSTAIWKYIWQGKAIMYVYLAMFYRWAFWPKDGHSTYWGRVSWNTFDSKYVFWTCFQ